MTRITFIQHDGSARTVDVAGGSAMQAAVSNGVAGIDADCGGACACGTCHVNVDPAWIERVGPGGAMETSMLDFAEAVRSNSRLACQIQIDTTLDGIVLRLRAAQH